MKKSIKNPIFILVLVFVLAFGISCGGGGSSSGILNTLGLDGYIPDDPLSSPKSDEDSSSSGNFEITSLDGHSIYAVASNQLVNRERSSNTYIKFSGGTDANILERSLSNNFSETKESREIISFFPPYENLKLEKGSNKLSYIEKSVVSVGSLKSFNVYDKYERLQKITCKLRKKTSFGDRVLNIWSDNDLNISDTTINKIESYFINTIYSNVTSIFGKEYYDGSPEYGNLINSNGEISIVLFNINGNFPGNSRTLGYYNPVDSFYKSSYSESNEIVGFYLDAYSLEDSNEDWRDSAYSTIAHEFLHSIVFYQRYVKRNTGTSRWFNEMLAMMTEDIMSNKLGLKGPREVTALSGEGNNLGGRIAYANEKPLNQVSYSNQEFIDYNTVYVFGAYLLRNFGLDLSIMRNMLQSNLDGFDSIENALGNTYKSYELIQNCAKGMILSKQIFSGNEKYKFNGGVNGFSAMNGNVEYKIGSINFYNYANPMYMYGIGSQSDTMKRGSSLLFKLVEDKSGTFNVNYSLPYYTSLEIVVIDKNGNYDINKSRIIYEN